MRRMLLLCLCTLAPQVPAGEWFRDPISRCEVWNALPAHGEVASWSGPCVDGKAEGRGVLTWFADGRLLGRFQGAIKAGRLHGWGEYHDRVAEGYDHYIGEFERGQRHGRGSLSLATGGRYEGGFDVGRPGGWGIWRAPTGGRVDGEFEDGLPHGVAIEERANGDMYKGQYERGLRSGQGILISADGYRYDGEFERGVPSGVGRLLSPDGTLYRGEFAHGRPHGEGRFTLASGEAYEGRFEAGKASGPMTPIDGEGKPAPEAAR